MGLLTLFGQTEEITPVLYTTDVETSTAGLAIFTGVWLFVYLAVLIIAVVAMWKVFTKAGEAGWQALIPIWNTIVLLKIVGRPMWWILLLLIPFVSLIIAIIVMLDLGKSFGKSTVFSIFGLIIFSLVGFMILAFGDAKYVGPAAGNGPAPAAA